MSRFIMQIYSAHNGVETTIGWANQEDYRLAQAFLKELVGGPCSRSESRPDMSEFYYLETIQQRDALHDFMQDLPNRRKGGAS